VFSPYYAWAGRKDPENHVSINVSLYEPKTQRWTMTERTKSALHRNETTFTVGPSALRWEDGAMVLDFDEISLPWPTKQLLPKRIKGSVTVRPKAMTDKVYDLDASGRHRWWPIAPEAEISVESNESSWRGHGYMDCNWGERGLEDDFHRWDWSRGTLADGQPVILYDTNRRDGSHGLIAVRFDETGAASPFDAPPAIKVKRGFWGVDRTIACDPGHTPTVIRTMEDGPFYTRSVISTHLMGQPARMMHESFSGDRFGSRFVKFMLPFRMPRRRG
jgi:carotenoid 1,2-hydratase